MPHTPEETKNRRKKLSGLDPNVQVSKILKEQVADRVEVEAKGNRRHDLETLAAHRAVNKSKKDSCMYTFEKKETIDPKDTLVAVKKTSSGSSIGRIISATYKNFMHCRETFGKESLRKLDPKDTCMYT